MDKKIKLDPKKIKYDGKGFSVVISDEKAFKAKLNKLRKEVLKNIKHPQALKDIKHIVSDDYIVFYTESCTPHIATFKSNAAATRFIRSFYERTVLNRVDNWVDCLIKGSLERTYEGWDSYIVIDKR